MKPIFTSTKKHIRCRAAVCAVVPLVFGLSRTAAAQSGTFSITGNMSNARTIHTATLLANGTVLVAGGFNPGVTSALASAELYNPNTGHFSATGSLNTARRAHSAALLSNGKVLVAGGRLPPTYFASAELYDPVTGLFSTTGSMSTPRAFFTATPLSNGKVLVVGGFNAGVYLASAEIYDPETGFFSPTGNLHTPREDHTATLLPDGRVLIAGGDIGAAAFGSAELYDPDTGLFTSTGSLITARTNHTATLLPATTTRPRGKVLVAGGDSLDNGGPPAFATAELYDPGTGLFSATGSMAAAREFHSAILLPAYELRPHGKILVAGGDNGNFSTGLLASAELYDPDTGLFTPTGSLTTARESNTATLLLDGGVLIAGGGTSKTTFASAELYALPPTYTLTDLGTLSGGTFSQASFVASTGLVTGVSTVADGTQHAVVWYNGQIADLTPGVSGPNSEVFGINERGQAVVQAESPTLDPNGEDFCGYGTHLTCLPFLWQDGAMTPLATLGGKNGTVGQINNRGEVAGVVENATKDKNCVAPQVLDFEAVVWGPKQGEIRQLPPLPGDSVGMALWINHKGQAVGATGTCANSQLPPNALGPHAVLWENDGSVVDLGNLGGTSNAALGVGNIALAISDQGQVVGASDLPGDTTNHAFLWTRETGMQDLGTLPGDVNSAGLGINDRGEVVGVSYGADGPFNGPTRAFLRQNGVMTDLNTLIPASSPLFLLFAAVINSSGQIVGFGATSSGDIHGFLATPSSGPDTSESLSPAAREINSPQLLPQDARRALQQGLRFGRSEGRFTPSR